MPKRTIAGTGASSPSDLPAGLSKPALRALAAAGYDRLDRLTHARESDLMALHGFGAKGLRILREALAARGKSFAPEKASAKTPAKTPSKA